MEKEVVKIGSLYQYQVSDKEIVPVEVVEYDGSSDNIEVRIVGEKLSNMVLRINKSELGEIK